MFLLGKLFLKNSIGWIELLYDGVVSFFNQGIWEVTLRMQTPPDVD